MIVANAKSSKASSSPLNLSVPKEKPALSFSDLLRGVSDKKDAKIVQNGSLILSLGDEEKSLKTAKSTSLKKDSPHALLKSEENLAPNKTMEPLELNPKLTAALSKTDIRVLVGEAKNYIKAKIQESEGYKKAEIKDLPNTLKGLVEAAKKFGIDITKISFEEVKSNAQRGVRQEDVKAMVAKDGKSEIAKEAVIEKKTVSEKELKTETPKGLRTEAQKEAKGEASKALTAEAQKEAKAEAPKEVSVEKKAQTVQTDEKQKNAAVSNLSASKIEQNEIKLDGKFAEIQKEIKHTPLFKAQAVAEHTSTEQIVQVKANSHSFKSEQKRPKERADETLKLLLRGEKPSTNNSALTADFSVATAKVIAPTATTESAKTLEHLLHGTSSSAEQSSSSAKMESLTTHKSDSFEVKLNEAKQMIRYLSADVKSAIEDYKSPFTRVKLQLNPQRLGEVDLTIVQRGKNLHVSISSNNTAINTLSMNANELRVQLSNNGINNATLNFSNGQQNSDTNAGGGHQQRHNERQAHEEYSYFEHEEANEEILSSLEIIVPRYI
ncbi:flagellar hook-length control protein FliK [Sulfurimonas sp.]|uniref:flagellar hook-length control protein FliK n=1 Tax=Sulfurimonas sp. TaxID=2022749 RepID=UPI0025CD9DA4|nr:flagellar hook-length control protein FliK [Sulfurimonas sp.]MBW6488384.1 flagellar hook-length control protein FliK [Sulfurimonas sp.]